MPRIYCEECEYKGSAVIVDRFGEDKMRKKQFIKVIAIDTDEGIAFEYGLVDAISKDEAYTDRDFNNEVCEHYKKDKSVSVFANDLVIDIQELRNNAGSSLRIID